MLPSANHFWEVEVSREERISFGKQKSTGDPFTHGKGVEGQVGHVGCSRIVAEPGLGPPFPPDTLH